MRARFVRGGGGRVRFVRGGRGGGDEAHEADLHEEGVRGAEHALQEVGRRRRRCGRHVNEHLRAAAARAAQNVPWGAAQNVPRGAAAGGRGTHRRVIFEPVEARGGAESRGRRGRKVTQLAPGARRRRERLGDDAARAAGGLSVKRLDLLSVKLSVKRLDGGRRGQHEAVQTERCNNAACCSALPPPPPSAPPFLPY